jgi:energy-coupling factor transport system substrate-specific component
MLQRVKVSILLIAVYTVVMAAGDLFFLLPGISGLHLTALFSLSYGMIFGRLGAFAAGTGALLGRLLTGGVQALFPFVFLTEFLAAYLPFRIWQGMRSEQEPVLLVYDSRTRIMALILSITSATPVALSMAFATDLFHILPFGVAYFPILLPTLTFSIVGGQTVFSYLGQFFFRGKGQPLWESVRDDKWTAELLSVALLRINLIALAVGAGLCLIFPPNIGNPTVVYTTGGLSLVLLLLTGI